MYVLHNLGETYKSEHIKFFYLIDYKPKLEGRTASNIKNWGIKEDRKCECSEEQDADHLFLCPLLQSKCRMEDFLTYEIPDKAIQITDYWEGKGI